MDQAVAIDEVKRFIAQQDLDAATRFVPEKVIPKVDGEFSEKIAIIGGGPAGLSCAYYLAEKGYRPTVFEKEAPSGRHADERHPQLPAGEGRRRGGDRRAARAGRGIPTAAWRSASDVTIAAAARGGLQGLLPGRRIAVRRSAAACRATTRDGVRGGYRLHARGQPARREDAASGRVVVIGGGNIAADVARTAVRCGAESVTMYCLEGYDEMPMGEEDRSECERGRRRDPRGLGPDGDHRPRTARLHGHQRSASACA